MTAHEKTVNNSFSTPRQFLWMTYNNNKKKKEIRRAWGGVEGNTNIRLAVLNDIFKVGLFNCFFLFLTQ